MVSIIEAKKIMGKNFIGPDELKRVGRFMSLKIFVPPPPIPYGAKMLKEIKNKCILILGVEKDKEGNPLTIKRLGEIIGKNSHRSEPCFYNQDWYLKENFATKRSLGNKWYLISKEIVSKSRGVDPENLQKKLPKGSSFPMAILTAFTFFSYYFLNKKLLWKYDFVWCNDRDSNDDRIYVGRYIDPLGKSKKGFNIHRHLAVRKCYGYIDLIK